MKNKNLTAFMATLLKGFDFNSVYIIDTCRDNDGTLVSTKIANNSQYDFAYSLPTMFNKTAAQKNYSIANVDNEMYVGVSFAREIKQSENDCLVSYENGNYANLKKVSNNAITHNTENHSAEITVTLQNTGNTDIVANYICLFVHARVTNFVLTAKKFETPLIIKPGGVYTTKITLF